MVKESDKPVTPFTRELHDSANKPPLIQIKNGWISKKNFSLRPQHRRNRWAWFRTLVIEVTEVWSPPSKLSLIVVTGIEPGRSTTSVDNENRHGSVNGCLFLVGKHWLCPQVPMLTLLAELKCGWREPILGLIYGTSQLIASNMD